MKQSAEKYAPGTITREQLLGDAALERLNALEEQ
jgi:hypothetical protein